jgi:hypothetical protein
LIHKQFLPLLRKRANQREARRIKHLALPLPAFPQSYPQKTGTGGKAIANHELTVSS